MSLTRYTLDAWCYGCDEPTKDAAKSDSGEWVPYEEAAALRARVAELEAALYEARDDVAETLNTVTGWGKRHRIDAVTRQLAHIDKLLEGYTP